jgi:hypothetical protein
LAKIGLMSVRDGVGASQRQDAIGLLAACNITQLAWGVTSRLPVMILAGEEIVAFQARSGGQHPLRARQRIDVNASMLKASASTTRSV